MQEKHLKSVERIRVLVLALGVVLSLVLAVSGYEPHFIISVVLGVILAWVNFFVIVTLVKKLLQGSSQSIVGLGVVGKYVLMMGLVALLILKLHVLPVALALGFSTLVVAILIEALFMALRAKEPSMISQ